MLLTGDDSYKKCLHIKRISIDEPEKTINSSFYPSSRFVGLIPLYPGDPFPEGLSLLLLVIISVLQISVVFLVVAVQTEVGWEKRHGVYRPEGKVAHGLGVAEVEALHHALRVGGNLSCLGEKTWLINLEDRY